MAEPFPRASPGVPPVAMALRLGAGPAKAAPTRRSVRRIFPAAHVAGKNDSDSFRLAPETRKGLPLPGPFPEGRESPVGCLLLLEAPAIRLAAGRLWRWGFSFRFCGFWQFWGGFCPCGAKKWFSSRLPAAIPGALPGGGEASSNLPDIGAFPRRDPPPGLCHFFRRRRRSETSYGTNYHEGTGR